MTDLCHRLRAMLDALNPQAYHLVRLRHGLAVSLLTIHETGGIVTTSGRADLEELESELRAALHEFNRAG